MYTKAQGPSAYASLKGGIHTSVINNYDSIVYYTAKWMDAYLNDNNDSKSIFMDGGELFKDTAWKDVQSKDVELNNVGSIFGNGNFKMMIILIGFVCIGMIFFYGKKKIRENEG